MTFGRHLQQLDDESRLVFYPLRIAPEGLAEKTLAVGLKLLPSLIRCLLIHGNYRPFLNEDDGQFKTKKRSQNIRAFALTETVWLRFLQRACLGSALHQTRFHSAAVCRRPRRS
jgi:hypothetical protein